jgi:thioredoxin reductase (NADPH)
MQMRQPVLLAVDADQEILAAQQNDLPRRFAPDYRTVTADTPEAALAELHPEDQVAVVIATQWLTGTTGGLTFYRYVTDVIRPQKRLLLITYGDFAAGKAAVQAMALGQVDHYLNKPWGDPELELYPTISELLSQRSRAAGVTGAQPEVVRIIGPQWSARSHQLRDLLTRNSIPHGFYDVAKPEGYQLLQQTGVDSVDQPVVLLFDGRVLIDPPNERIAEVLGVQTRPASSLYDLPVVAAIRPGSPPRCTRPQKA